MRLWFLIVILLMLCMHSSEVLGAEWHLKDKHGQTVFSLRCRRLEYCGAGIYKYWKGAEQDCHFIDRDGRPVAVSVPDGFDLLDILISADSYDKPRAGDLPEDTLLIVKKAKMVGVVDVKGKFRLDPTYWYIEKLDNFRLRVGEVSAITAHQENYLYDLRDGSKILDNQRFPKPSYTKSSGLYPFEQPPPDGFSKPVLWGYKSGINIVVPAQFDYAGEFDGAYAGVTKFEGDQQKCYLIGRDGLLASPAFNSIHPFQNDLAVASSLNKPSGQGLVNYEYQFVLAPHFWDLTFLVPGFMQRESLQMESFLP